MVYILNTTRPVERKKYILNTTRPIKKEEQIIAEERKKWNNDDYSYMGHILNSMLDILFDIYKNIHSAKVPFDKFESR